MANTVGKEFIFSALHTLAEEFYNRDPYAPVQNPSGLFIDPLLAGYGSLTFVIGSVDGIDVADQKRMKTIGDEWYHRVHITPNVVSLGNLLSAQSFDVEVWSAFFGDELLNSISETSTDGIELTEPAEAPLTFNPLEAKTYSVSVSPSGPSVIDGVYTFNFDSASLDLAIDGKRVVVWPFVPQADFTESVEFKTDVIKTKSSEQRIALRAYPRISYQGTFLLDENIFSTIKAIMTQWGYRQFAFPVWPEFSFVGPVPSGTLTIDVDTTQSTYRVGDPVILYQDHNINESAEIESITDTSVTLKLPFVTDFTNAIIMPVSFMSLHSGMTVGRNANKVPIGSALFSGFDSVDISSDTGKAQLRGKDVYLERTAAISEVSEKLFTDVDILDNMAGVQLLVPNRTFSEHAQVLSFDCQNKDQLWGVKQWLYSLKGKQKSFFIPSWNMDLSLVNPITTSDATLLVNSIRYNLYYTEKDILLLLKDGTELILRAIAGTDAGGGTESITLDAQVGQEVALEEVDVISFISHVRLDADRFEVKYTSSGGGAVITIPITEIPE